VIRIIPNNYRYILPLLTNKPNREAGLSWKGWV